MPNQHTSPHRLTVTKCFKRTHGLEWDVFNCRNCRLQIRSRRPMNPDTRAVLTEHARVHSVELYGEPKPSPAQEHARRVAAALAAGRDPNTVETPVDFRPESNEARP